jgi:hypothetical protein
VQHKVFVFDQIYWKKELHEWSYVNMVAEYCVAVQKKKQVAAHRQLCLFGLVVDSCQK